MRRVHERLAGCRWYRGSARVVAPPPKIKILYTEDIKSLFSWTKKYMYNVYTKKKLCTTKIIYISSSLCHDVYLTVLTVVWVVMA